MEAYDLIVIGGGPRGIAAASAAAKSGARVKLVEAQATLGGRFGGAGPQPAFRGVAARDQVLSLARLGIDGEDLGWRPARSLTALTQDQAPLILSADRPIAYRTLETRKPFESERWQRLAGSLARAAARLPREAQTNPNVRRKAAGADLAALVAGLDLPGEALRDVMGLAARPAGEWVEGALSDPALRAGVMGPALFAGPLTADAAGSAAQLAETIAFEGDRLRLDFGLVWHGADQAGTLLRQALSDAGVDVELGVRAASVTAQRQAVTGVELDDGRHLQAAQVVSTLDLKATMLGLFDWDGLPKSILRDVRAVRGRGDVGRLTMTLDRLPDGHEAWSAGPVYLNTDPRAATLAANLERQSRVADALPVELVLTRAGQAAVVTAILRGLPEQPHGETWRAAQRESVFTDVCAAMTPLWPDMKSAVREWSLETPLELEQRLGWTHGQPYADMPTIAARLAGLEPEAERIAARIKGLSLGGVVAAAPARPRLAASA